MKTPSIVSLIICCSLMFWGNAASANYLKNPKVKPFIDKMVKEHGFDVGRLNKLFSLAEKKESILKAIARPAEKRLEWKGYRNIFIKADRIKQGKEFLKTHQKTLARAEKEYGVPKAIIAAIIGVETRYGRHAGSYRVIDALSTLAFDYPPRSKFFTKELVQYLLMAREQQLNSLEVKGSYAGAMGYGQFMPSSYRSYAVDFSGDKQTDIMTNPVDAIGSVANYFKRHHWQEGKAVAFPANLKTVPPVSAALTKKLKPSLTLGELKKLGVTSPVKLPMDANAKLLLLKGDKGDEYWLTLDNFYVITRYNHSSLYAMAVFQLAEALSAK